MKMNKEELKRQIKLNSHLEYDKVEWRPASVYVPVVMDLIDQLDEPKGVPEEEFERLFEDHQKLAHELDDMKLRYEPEKVVVPEHLEN